MKTAELYETKRRQWKQLISDNLREVDRNRRQLHVNNWY